MHICKLSLFWLIFAWYMFSHSVLVLWDITGFYTFTEILLLLFLQFFFLSICLLFLSRLLLDSFNLFPSLLLQKTVSIALSLYTQTQTQTHAHAHTLDLHLHYHLWYLNKCELISKVCISVPPWNLPPFPCSLVCQSPLNLSNVSSNATFHDACPDFPD